MANITNQWRFWQMFRFCFGSGPVRFSEHEWNSDPVWKCRSETLLTSNYWSSPSTYLYVYVSKYMFNSSPGFDSLERTIFLFIPELQKLFHTYPQYIPTLRLYTGQFNFLPDASNLYRTLRHWDLRHFKNCFKHIPKYLSQFDSYRRVDFILYTLSLTFQTLYNMYQILSNTSRALWLYTGQFDF